jgi:hypothetical protein
MLRSLSLPAFSRSHGSPPISRSGITLSHSRAPQTALRTVHSVTIHIGGANGSVSPDAATVSVGSSANFNVTLNSQNGYTDQFTFSCPTAPAGVTCKFSPSTGLLPAGGTLTSALTVTVTSKTSSTGSVPASRFYREDPSWPLRVVFLLWAVLFVYLCLKIKLSGTGRRAYTAIAFASGLVLILSVLVACGGGSAGGVSAGQPSPPPPQAATATISIQASSDHINSPLGIVTVTIP